MYQQAQINNFVNDLVNSYTGKTDAYQGGYLGQSIVPIAYYVQMLTGVTAPDLDKNWGANFPSSLAPYFNYESYTPGSVYPKGTILVWDSGHMAIVLSSDGGLNTEVFEQNGDPGLSGCHSASRLIEEPGVYTCTHAFVPLIKQEEVKLEPKAPPAAPIPFPYPKTNENYVLITAVPGFFTYTQAIRHTGISTPLVAGAYYVITRESGMIKIARELNQPGKWINPVDNVSVPVPQPVTQTVVITDTDDSWKDTYTGFANSPVMYKLVQDYTAKDISGEREPINLSAGSKIGIFGQFAYNGVWYYRPKLKDDSSFKYWYGVNAKAVIPVTSKVAYVPRSGTIKVIDILPEWFKNKIK
jgi:hypothetical protein